MWEDSPKGGCWIVTLPLNKNINVKWERLLLACIGEHFNDLNVVGVVLSLRTNEEIIQLWLKDTKLESSKLEASKKLKELLEIDFTNIHIYFKDHEKSMIVSMKQK